MESDTVPASQRVRSASLGKLSRCLVLFLSDQASTKRLFPYGRGVVSNRGVLSRS